MAIRFVPAADRRLTSTSFRSARLGPSAQLAGHRADLGVIDDNVVDAVFKRTTMALVTQWFETARQAEAHVVSAAASLQKLIDTDHASCAMIVAYNRAATRLYKTHGEAWRSFRTLLKTDDLRPPKPPPLFGSQVKTGTSEEGAFVLYVDVPCAAGENAGPTGQIKRFDLPAQVAFRPSETFSDAFRAKSGGEMKAAAMSHVVDRQLAGGDGALGAGPAVVAAISLERVVAAAMLAITAYVIFKALYNWLSGNDAAQLQKDYAVIQADCALEQIKFYEKCIADGGDTNTCAQATATIKCPKAFVPPRGVLDQASGLVLTVGLVAGGFFLLKLFRDRQRG